MVMSASGGGPGAPHRPVLLDEAVLHLAPERGGLFIDATLGLGGHSEALLSYSPQVWVLGIDRDIEALEFARRRLAQFDRRFQAVQSNFNEFANVLEETGETAVSGILADLGVSSLQFDSVERGFSFCHDAPLDMRMNASGEEETAAELLARLPEEEIARIIFEYGEEHKSRRIARWIVERREAGQPIERTSELAELVVRAVGYKRTDRIHPATRTFQALRIAVNRELEGLEAFLEEAIALLQPSGRLVVISFHSLEDRIVKRTLRRLAGQCECDPRLPVCNCGARRAVEILTRRPVTPTQAELDNNPRSRSAKLRACRKLEDASAERGAQT